MPWKAARVHSVPAARPASSGISNRAAHSESRPKRVKYQGAPAARKDASGNSRVARRRPASSSRELSRSTRSAPVGSVRGRRDAGGRAATTASPLSASTACHSASKGRPRPAVPRHTSRSPQVTLPGEATVSDLPPSRQRRAESSAENGWNGSRKRLRRIPDISAKSAASCTWISTSRASSEVLSCREWRTTPGVTVQVWSSSTAGSSVGPAMPRTIPRTRSTAPGSTSTVAGSGSRPLTRTSARHSIRVSPWRRPVKHPAPEPLPLAMRPSASSHNWVGAATAQCWRCRAG